MSIWQGVRAATICGHTGDQAVTPGLVVALAICVCDRSPVVTTNLAGQQCDAPVTTYMQRRGRLRRKSPLSAKLRHSAPRVSE